METRLHIALISNIIFEPHFLPLTKQYFGENTAIFPIPFGEHIEVEYQTQLASADLVVVWLNLENRGEMRRKREKSENLEILASFSFYYPEMAEDTENT